MLLIVAAKRSAAAANHLPSIMPLVFPTHPFVVILRSLAFSVTANISCATGLLLYFAGKLNQHFV
jgi:hypothetical protein